MRIRARQRVREESEGVCRCRSDEQLCLLSEIIDSTASKRRMSTSSSGGSLNSSSKEDKAGEISPEVSISYSINRQSPHLFAHTEERLCKGKIL